MLLAAIPLDARFQILLAAAGFAAILALLAARRIRARGARRIAIVAAVALGGIFLAGAWGRFVEPSWIVPTTTRLAWSGPPLRVAVLSDVHAGRTRRDRVDHAVELANAANPDLVLLAGDYITGYEATPDKLAILEGLRPLRARLGVFAVLGNHDSEPYETPTPRAAALTHFLEGLGFVVLRNASREVAPGVTLIGLDEVQSGNIDPDRAFAGVPTSGARIVLTHDWHGLSKPGVGHFDLAVTGHTHGGQLCLPFTRLCPLGMHNAPYLAGMYDWPRGGKLFVTRGLGESAILARFACRPEVAVIELAP
jgi:predicted MPP superfamily phosphohydrolase